MTKLGIACDFIRTRCLLATCVLARQSFHVLWQIIRDVVPRRSITYPGVKLRAYARISVECAHPYRNFVAVRPIAAKQTRSAIAAKSFDCAFAFAVDANQVSTVK